ncbi:MAG: nicotinate-nucleotide--dimethylbenzimidazole phosphoribosyltransferase [Dehalococcoidia bacterium]|jgi:nicotinate-nucleotide--dimethylbenzimidazole phosphoribosyltransferase
MSDIITRTIGKIESLDRDAMAAARARQEELTKPAGSLGVLEELSVQLAGIQGKSIPRIKNKTMIIMAGDHGVVIENIGNWPQEVTAQMVANIINGGAGINVIARQVGAGTIMVDMGVATDLNNSPELLIKKVAYGTANMTAGPAMTEEQAEKAVETGIELAENEAARGADIIGTGDMGIGNTTPSSAICAVLTGRTVEEVTGRGTGLTDEQLSHKIEIVKRALAVNEPEAEKPLEVLAKVGGFEIGGLAGVILGAAARRIPVVIDGFISGAAAMLAVAMCLGVKDFLMAGHLSAEPGHRIMLEHLGLKPLLNLEMRLGEGTGAALGIFLAETAARILGDMATFAEAGVDEGDG